MGKKKKKNIIWVIFIAIFAIIGIALGAKSYIENTRKSNKEASKARWEEYHLSLQDVYLISEEEDILLYKGTIETEEDFLGKELSYTIILEEDISLPKKSTVSRCNHEETVDGIKYTEIKYNDEYYYIKSENYTEDPKDFINFSKLYVRTSVTIYKDFTSNNIAGFAPKGSCLEILNFDSFDEDLNVNMYNVKYEDVTGWVFAKYLVETQEEADALYNENGEADFHKDSVGSYETYGGDPLLLDYYPVEKPSFEDNVLLADARAMYLCAGCASNWKAYLKCAQDLGINAVCIDIFDGIMGYDSEIVASYSPSLYEYSKNSRYFSTSDWGEMVSAFKEAGIYVIGRIVCFNDSYYAKDHPEDCVDYSGTKWPSVFARGVWEYKVALAIEAVRLYGFNEIQLDYIRFSDDTIYASIYGADFKNKYGETKSQSIQNFLFYACDMIHREGAYVSADVFGSSASGIVPECGQYWSAISNVVDVICAMPYTDHFTPWGNNSYYDYWEDPYGTLKWWGGLAKPLQDHTPTPAIARTWITGYDTPYWNPYCTYGADEIAEEAQGLADAGLYGGFLVWNAGGDLNKLYSIGYAWTKKYE